MISVIVPVYKVEEFLDRCVKSIVEQTYTDLEIILVNDGSPDKCPDMCEAWAKKDKRIKVVHKKNGGLSDARNAGLEVSTGEYIAFVDSDDYVDTNIYMRLHEEMMKQDVDIICCKYVDVNEKGERIDRTVKFFDEPNYNQVYKGRDFLVALLESKSMPVAWNKLYKRKVIEEKYFKKDIYSEDYFFLLTIAYKELSVYFIEDELLFYTAREKSITDGFNEAFNLDQVMNVFNAEEFLKEKFGEDIDISIKTAQFKAIRLFLARMPYKYIKTRRYSYWYVYKKLKENRKYILTKNHNNLFDKAFLITFFISKRFTKYSFDFVSFIWRKTLGMKN